MWRWRLFCKGLGPALAVLALGGCALTVPGAPVRVPGGPAPGADLSLLNPGNFPTQPVPPLGAAGSPAQGALIEARRMADYVTGPWDVDSTLVQPSFLRAGVLKDTAGVALIVPSAVASAAQAHQFINGFSSSRQAGERRALTNAVLRFADPPSAAAAAADMTTAAATGQPGPTLRVPIPGHPEALAVTYGYRGEATQPQTVTELCYTAHGSYVLTQQARAETADGAAALIAATLDRQGPQIDQFVATDPAHFADLPADPAGLLAHTMPAPTWPAPANSAPTNPKIGLYGPYGALHLQDDPPPVAAALTAAGVTTMSYNQSIIYVARDPAAAGELVDALAEVALSGTTSAQPIDGVNGLPASRCVRSGGTSEETAARYTCYAVVGGFTVQTRAADDTTARQEVAAQYKMLTGPGR
ncbi:MAG: hypothetical protein JO280_00825 [Mycobacteriaceae bacterium]|nr:hypothetical protein [Mycobacteriaceae bacterium]